MIAAILSPGILLAMIGWIFSSGQGMEPTSLMGLFLLVVGIVISFFIVAKGREIEHV